MNNPAVTWQGKGIGAQAQESQRGESPWPFRLVLLSLIFEFGRPQELIPGIRAIPIPTLINALIAMSVFSSGKWHHRNPQTKLWLPLLGLMAIHVPIAVNNFWAAMILKDMGLVFCLYLGLITYVNTIPKMRTLISVWLGLHVITAGLGIAHEGHGVGGWMGDENDFCIAINMVLPFAFFMQFTTSSPAQKIKYAGLMGLFAFTIMVTLSRGGFMGMVSAGAYCWFKSALKIGAVFVVVLLMLFMAAVAPDTYWDEIRSSFSDETLEVGTGADRMYIWGIGFEMFLANPIFGIGQGNFPWTFEQYEAGRTFLEASRAGRAAHSLYFTLMPEMGVVGVGIFVAMLVYNRKDVKTIERIAKSDTASRTGAGELESDDKRFALSMARAMEGSMIAFLVSSVFVSTLWYPSFWVMMGFIVALKNIAVASVGEGEGEQSHSVTSIFGARRRTGLVRPTRGRLKPLRA